jgi:hypothetical protein
MTLNLSGMTQLAGFFAVSTATVNGNAAASISSVAVGTDGALSYQLTNGSTVSAYKIPLATVPSPDNLLATSGNVYSPNILSGQASVGTAGTGPFGAIKSSELELKIAACGDCLAPIGGAASAQLSGLAHVRLRRRQEVRNCAFSVVSSPAVKAASFSHIVRPFRSRYQIARTEMRLYQ